MNEMIIDTWKLEDLSVVMKLENLKMRRGMSQVMMVTILRWTSNNILENENKNNKQYFDVLLLTNQLKVNMEEM